MSTKHEIDAEIKELEEILATDRNLYQIPDYQRPYEWGRDNLAELIDDLVTAYRENPQENYFCGSLVLVENANDKRYDVVDGQQRLTTFVIMACVFRDSYRNELSKKAIANVEESIEKRHGNEEKLRLRTDVHYQTYFQETVLKEGIDFEGTPEKNNRYLANAHHINELLSDKFSNSPDSVSGFVEWLYEKVLLTMITCNTEDSAIRIFDVLNSRGIPLTPVDILKARLMQQLSQEDREAFNATWNQVDMHLKDADLAIDDMLSTYLYYKKAPNSKVRLDKALGAVFKEENMDSLKIVHELDGFSKSYSAVLAESDKHRYCLQYLNHHIYWHSILVTAAFEKYPHIAELKSLLVAYFYQNWIAGSYITRIKQTSLNVLKHVKSHKPIVEIKEEIQKNLDRYGITETFFDELKKKNVYSRKWTRALLLLIEYFSTDDSTVVEFVELQKQLHVEHILPQTPLGEWQDIFEQEQIDEWTHSLANLTLLSGKKDSEASNYPFSEKKEVYLCKGDVATSFLITQEVGRCEKWDVSELKKRRERLLKKVREKLDIF